MAISINLRMNRGQWADFADWLDERYTTEKWHFYGRYNQSHSDLRKELADRSWENSEAIRCFYVGPTASIIGNTVVLLIDGGEAEAFTLIKMFHEEATVVSHGVFKSPTAA